MTMMMFMMCHDLRADSFMISWMGLITFSTLFFSFLLLSPSFGLPLYYTALLLVP